VRRSLLLAIAMLALCAQPASAAKGMEVALQDDPVFVSQSYYDRERALQQAHDLGVTRIRVNMIWADVVNAPKDPAQPSPVAYDWQRFDSLIDAAARYGIRVQLTLTGSAPAWATSNRKSGVYGPKASSFGDFTRAVATHFKGRVDRYSIWNEPNYVSWMQPFEKAPALYRELYQAAYAQIKRADKRALVLMGETAPYAIRKRAIAPLEFLRDVTCATGVKAGGGSGSGALDPGVDPNDTTAARARVRAAAAKTKPPKLVRGPCKPLKADGYAHHPYDYRHRPDYAYKGSDNATLGSLSRLTGTLQSLAKIGALRQPKGSKPPPVYLTEYGYFQSGKYALAETARTAYLKKGYTMAQRDRNVAQMLQFGLVTPPTNFIGGYFDLSLVHLDGTPTPGYEALRSWAATAGKRGQIKLPGAAIALPPAPSGKRRGR
jgi:hypothetical protein